MASESCSTSSSSSGDDFVPIFFLRKVTKSFRRIYDKKRSTIRWMKRMQLQLQLKLSSMKTKAIQTWTCVRLLLEWGRHSGVSVESASCRDQRQTGTRLLFWLCRVCGESSLSVEGLHVDLQLSRSTCQCFQASWPHSVTCSWTALTGFLDMTKRPLKCLTQQQVSEKYLLFFSACASFLRRWIVESPLFVSFLHISLLKWQSSHPTNVVEIPRSS